MITKQDKVSKLEGCIALLGLLVNELEAGSEPVHLDSALAMIYQNLIEATAELARKA